MQTAGPPTLSNFPPVIGFLLAANGLVFLLQGVVGPQALIGAFGLWPLAPETSLAHMVAQPPTFQIWQLVTYAFLHGGLFHLLVNLLAMWILGVHLEHAWGSRTFATYFLVCIVGAGLVQLLVATQAAAEGQIYPTIGASGGVFGILLAFGMMFPNHRLVLLFPPIPIRAKYFVIGYGAFELFAGITGTTAGVAHFAHLGGMAFGFLLIQYWRARLPIKPRFQKFPW